MSRLAKSTTSKGAIPKTAGKPGQKGKPGKGKESKKDPRKEVVEWTLPAFSVPPQMQKQDINWEKLKKDNARRQSPEGEDIKEIRRVLRELKGKDVPVHEFINLVSAYTADNGAALRSVMAEDLESFRKLAKKVYETMTQDVSDVLVNEQLQMVQYYEEKSGLLSEKMMRSINDIYEMAPDFDFQRFLKDKDDYIQSLLPLPREAEMMSDDAFEMVRRQQAYHRLQWLRSEGERMSEENKRLLRRLEELKVEQRMEQERATDLARDAETQRQQLAQEESEMKDKLEQLNDSIEKSFIRDELRTTQEHNRAAREPTSESDVAISTGGVRKTRSGIRKAAARGRKPQWSSTTAAEIEEEAGKTAVATETTKKTTSKTGLKRAKGKSAKTPQSRSEREKETSPFHFSPIKTPPPQDEFGEFGEAFGRRCPAKPKKQRTPPPSQQAYGASRKTPKPAPEPKKEASPFHYTPPTTPPGDVFGQHKAPQSTKRQRTPPPSQDVFGAFGKSKPPPQKRETSPFHFSPTTSPQYGEFGVLGEQSRPRKQETRIEQATTTIQQKRQRCAAPKDSWGGFY